MKAAAFRLAPIRENASLSEPTWDEALVSRTITYPDRYWRLRIRSWTIAAKTQPGQFVMLTLARPGEDSPVLPRPIAVFDADPHTGSVDVVYGIVGSGTRRLATFRPGEQILGVVPLGQGFGPPAGTERLLLLGRGIGTCSLTLLAARLGNPRRSLRCAVVGTGGP